MIRSQAVVKTLQFTDRYNNNFLRLRQSRMSHDLHYAIEVATNHAELSVHLAPWQKLVSHSLEENVYLQPEFLIPAFEYRQFNCTPLAVFIYEVRKHERHLVMVAAFENCRSNIRVPFAHLQSTAGQHGYLVRPMLHRERAVGAVQALLEWLADDHQDWKAVIFRHLCSESPVSRLLLEQLKLHENSIMRYRTFKRAVLEGVDSFDEYLSVLPAKRRQDYRRNRRRLEAAGDLQIDCRVIDDVNSDFADRFAMMERQSWKGANSTALASSESAHAFLSSITEKFAARRGFYACEIVLNGRSISMSHNLLGAETMFAFKIAFDTESRTFSPGIQLAIETVRSLLRDGIEKADGGNAGDSFMSQLWPRQLQFENVFMPVSLSSRLFAKMADQAISFQHRDVRIASSTGV